MTRMYDEATLWVAIIGSMLLGASMGIAIGSSIGLKGEANMAKRAKVEPPVEPPIELEGETPVEPEEPPPVEDETPPADEGELEECLERLRKVEGKVERLEAWVTWARDALAKTGKYLPLRISPPPD